MPFEEVDYWQELTQVFDWSKSMFIQPSICVKELQAGLYYSEAARKRTKTRA